MRRDQRRALGKWIAFGGPCVTACSTATAFYLPDPIGSTLLSAPFERPFLALNAGLAVIAGMTGGWLLGDSPLDSLWKSPTLGLFAFFAHFCALVVLVFPLVIER